MVKMMDHENASETGPSASQVASSTSRNSGSIAAACLEAERAALGTKVQTLEQKHALDIRGSKVKGQARKACINNGPGSSRDESKSTEARRSWLSEFEDMQLQKSKALCFI